MEERELGKRRRRRRRKGRRRKRRRRRRKNNKRRRKRRKIEGRRGVGGEEKVTRVAVGLGGE